MAYRLPSDIQNRGQSKLSGLASLADAFVTGDLRNRQTEMVVEKDRAEKMFIRTSLADLYGTLETAKTPMEYNKRLDESSLKLLSYGGDRSASVAGELGKRRLRLPAERNPLQRLLGSEPLMDDKGTVIGERERYGVPGEGGAQDITTRTEELKYDRPTPRARTADEAYLNKEITFEEYRNMKRAALSNESGSPTSSAALKTLETAKNAAQRKLHQWVNLGTGIDLDEILRSGKIPEKYELEQYDQEQGATIRKAKRLPEKATKDIQEWLDVTLKYEERAKIEDVPLEFGKEKRNKEGSKEQIEQQSLGKERTTSSGGRYKITRKK